MSRTITALFDSRSDAEAARGRLTAANIDADNVSIVDQDGGDGSSGMTSSSSSSAGGFLASLKNLFIPDEDRETYSEGIRRGGYLLCASVDDDDTDRTIMLLEETGSVDMDERERSWKSEGWAGYSPSKDTATGYQASGDNMEEERIQLGEEKLSVGKREVNRGGARIRSYVVETPVTEQVQLREEHVNVERRPVDGDFAAGNPDKSALFQERNIEMTETAEEAVVDKQARVTEELVVSKTADERTETISDSVRRTEVDIDEGLTDRSTATDTAFDTSKDRDRF